MLHDMLHFENCNVFKQFFARGNKVKFNQFSLFVEILFADETLKKTLNDNENKRKFESVIATFKKINYYASITMFPC